MTCQFDITETPDGKYLHVCSVCGRSLKMPFVAVDLQAVCRGDMPVEAKTDLLRLWMYQHGINQKYYDTIEENFGIPGRTCNERKIWEKDVMKWLRKEIKDGSSITDTRKRS